MLSWRSSADYQAVNSYSMELVIDTTQPGILVLELRENQKRVSRLQKQTEKLSEEILSQINFLLRRHRVNLRELQKISVNPGPGGFSSTRTGVTVANALAYALDIPVATWPGGRVKKMVLPHYDHPPHITRPKPV